MSDRILIAVGANLPAPGFCDVRSACKAALTRFESIGVAIAGVSPWFESAPVPASDQPWYVNSVVAVTTALAPGPLLAALHAIEAEFGRRRGAVNAARFLDLDLLDYDGVVSAVGAWPVLPHPRMHQRAFVLLPLRCLRPEWRHPATGAGIADLIAALPPDQDIRRCDGEGSPPPHGAVRPSSGPDTG